MKSSPQISFRLWDQISEITATKCYSVGGGKCFWFQPFLFIQDFFIRIIYKKQLPVKLNQKQRISGTEVLLEMKIYISGDKE